MPNHRDNTADYRRLVLTGAPLIDLRAPVEFQKSAVATAVNLPLMTDEEREQVGTCYKNQGQQAAIALGHQLVAGEEKQIRLAKWLAFAKENPHGFLCCFRGGLRSQTVQQWMREAGVDYPLVEGGYKALRRFLIDECQRIYSDTPLYILSGLTGSDKTPLLLQQKNHIDLEGLANHRGSSFGAQLTPQPTQVTFENQLAIAMLQLDEKNAGYILLEDESRLIGARSVPPEMHLKMKQSPLVILKVSFEQRVENIIREYVVERLALYRLRGDQNPFASHRQYLVDAIYRIRKRLGNQVHGEIHQLMEQAVEAHSSNDDLSLHREWIIRLLTQYYDPMYGYQLSRKIERVVFEGDESAVSEYLASLEPHAG